uniref:U-box domain-containing protein 33-like n=1 Tax=Fragaria vesca subsp. vesca TaxID=101020 RepID=UPI0005CACCC2|nr:PREDICTED: U-box domain-containing protein 33-like [Fragaria vesca subsp. vesca]
MELMQHSHPPHHRPAGEPTSGFSPPVSFRRGFGSPAASSQLPEIFEETGDGGGGGGGGDKVHVAVGKSVEKAVSLLRWSVKQFGGREICILHVHQPAHLIPTLLGKLPASKANAEVVSAFRKEEKEQKMKLLQSYLIICGKAKVKASIAMVEADEIQKGIVESVHRHGVRKLVMGTVPENCMKVKRSSGKASYAAKNAPLFCEIWFINKGKHLWTRAASEGQSALPTCTQLQIASEGNFEPIQHRKNEEFHPECLQSSSANNDFSRISNWFQSDPGRSETAQSPSTLSCSTHIFLPHNIHASTRTSSSSGSGYSSAEGRASLDSDLCSRLTEATLEVEASMEKASSELLKCNRLESEAMEAIDKVKAFEFAYAREIKLRTEAEDALRTTLDEQERMLEEKEELSRNIRNTMRNIALLDSRVHEANRRSEEASGEVKQIQTSIAALCQEKQGIQRQKMEAIRWLERWRSHRQAGAANYNGLIGSVEELLKLAEFSLSDLQTATCNFSESFKIGQGGYGCVYKGEMLGRTVAIRKLHPHNMQGQSEFQQEVQVLCKIQHPHLVTLLGVCLEAWSLVYEYLPNGSLQDHLFRKSNVSFMTWKTRVRIIAEISSALCFLHSSKPEKIVHGDLKPQNILLDSEFRCKICDFGICRLVTEENLYSANFGQFTEPKGAFSYTDPELQRIGVLTPKSDIYSFGLIILQLVTRRPPVGLANEVRKALLSGNLTAILDSSAGEWPDSVAKRLVQLGLQCCELNSRARPELTPSLVREFEQLHVSEERPVPSFFLCPIRQEIMHDPQVAADGFTYEGEALLKWLQNGGETSPMTNLKLSHLHLTPNHALRLAIQDWLCKS